MNKIFKTSRFLTGSATVVGFILGMVFYFSYAMFFGAWFNVYLVGSCLLIAVILPFYHKQLKNFDDYITLKTAIVTFGRFGRFIFEFAFNSVFFSFLLLGGVIPIKNLSLFGGIFGFSILSAVILQGAKLIALMLSSRNRGSYDLDLFIGVSISAILGALSIAEARLFQVLYICLGCVFVVALFGYSSLSDLRKLLAPKGGIGIFPGTFNPFHNTHYDIINNIFKERKLDKLYIHSTVIPKLHRDALNNGEIEIAGREMGMRIYKKTDKADKHKNYFPTGDKFFEYETRVFLLKLAIENIPYRDKIVVLDRPDIYEKDGFYGIINLVKKLHPNENIHGVHGSDSAGMWIRRIFDESGWIYPYAVKRVNTISATAVRNGAQGMTPNIIERILDFLRNGVMEFGLENKNYVIKDGILKEA